MLRSISLWFVCQQPILTFPSCREHNATLYDWETDFDTTSECSHVIHKFGKAGLLYMYLSIYVIVSLWIWRLFLMLDLPEHWLEYFPSHPDITWINIWWNFVAEWELGWPCVWRKTWLHLYKDECLRIYWRWSGAGWRLQNCAFEFTYLFIYLKMIQKM